MIVCNRRVIHHLQQDVVDVLMGLLDLVQQKHRVGGSSNRIRQDTALLVTNISRRGTDETADGVPFLVLAHIVTVQGNAQFGREAPGQLGLPYAGGTDK